LRQVAMQPSATADVVALARAFESTGSL
jgi:hypothetical protein